MEKLLKAFLFHWLWKEKLCVASPHPPFCRFLESTSSRHVSVSGPIGGMGCVVWEKLWYQAPARFPWCWDPVHPEQEPITSAWCSSDAAVVLCSNDASVLRREQCDQRISLNLMPPDKAAQRESRARYVPDAPHGEAGVNQGSLKRTRWSCPNTPPAKGSEAEPDLCALGETPQPPCPAWALVAATISRWALPPAHPLRVRVGTERDALTCCECWSPKDSSGSGRYFLLAPKAVLAGQVCVLGEFVFQRAALGDGANITIDVNEIVGSWSHQEFCTNFNRNCTWFTCLSSLVLSQLIHTHPAIFITVWPNIHFYI